MQSPLISVVMAVYNGKRYLAEAIESILAQTEKNFELIIVDDGSTDTTLEILQQYKDQDPRIKIHSRKENKGLTYSLNEGLAQAQGVYIARMDADDIALPQRLEKQLAYIKQHKLDLCGTYADVINEQGVVVGEMTYPPDADSVRTFIFRHNPFIHPSVMVSNKVIQTVGNYSSFFKHIEDYELWTRIVFKYATGNLPEKLLHYRVHNSQITKKYHTSMLLRGITVRLLALARYLF